MTCEISRSAVVFISSGTTVRVGEVLQYVLVLPGFAGKAGAVASCRGRVIRADAVVVVTIDKNRLQTAAVARAAGRDARKRRLVNLCAAAGPAALSNEPTPVEAP